MNLFDQARNALKAGRPQETLNLLASLPATAGQALIQVQHLRAQAAMLIPELDLALASLRAVTEQLLSAGLAAMPRALSVTPPTPDTRVMTERALQVLAMLHNLQLPAFPFFGTLLGLLREGQMIKGDKDVDLCVWLDYYQLTRDLLRRAGFREATGTPPFDNFTSFACPQTGVIFDLMGLRQEPENQRILGGFWLYGKPASWQRLSDYAWFDLETAKTPQGLIRMPRQSQHLLEVLYGDWKTPDPQWDNVLQARNLLGASTQYRCYAYLRLLEALRHGKPERARYLANAISERLSDEPILLGLRDRLNDLPAQGIPG